MVTVKALRDIYRRIFPPLSISIPGGIRLWVTLVSLGFVFSVLLGHGGQFSQFSLSRLSIGWLIAGLLTSCLSLFINAYAWSLLLAWLGHSPKGLPVLSLYLKTNLLKYLPGGVWHFVERIRALRKYMDTRNALASVFLEPILMVVAALLFVPFGGWQSGFSLICCVPVLSLLPFFREPLLKSLQLNKVKQLKKLDSELVCSIPIEDGGTRRLGYPFKPLFVEMLFLGCRFGGFYCCLEAFSLGVNLSWGEWLSAFAFAWTVGFVIPAAPGGVGVFEASVFLKVSHLVPEVSLLGAVLSYRVISTMSDLFAALLAESYSFFRKSFLN